MSEKNDFVQKEDRDDPAIDGAKMERKEPCKQIKEKKRKNKNSRIKNKARLNAIDKTDEINPKPIRSEEVFNPDDGNQNSHIHNKMDQYSPHKTGSDRGDPIPNLRDKRGSDRGDPIPNVRDQYNQNQNLLAHGNIIPNGRVQYHPKQTGSDYNNPNAKGLDQIVIHDRRSDQFDHRYSPIDSSITYGRLGNPFFGFKQFDPTYTRLDQNFYYNDSLHQGNYSYGGWDYGASHQRYIFGYEPNMNHHEMPTYSNDFSDPTWSTVPLAIPSGSTGSSNPNSGLAASSLPLAIPSGSTDSSHPSPTTFKGKNDFVTPLTSDDAIDHEKLKKLNEALEKERFASLPAVVKYMYKEHKEVSKFTPEEVTNLRKQKKGISVGTIDGTEPQNVPNIITKFKHAFHTFKTMMKKIRSMDFQEPSPIQCQMWPLLMSGRDVIGTAQTGTGKTLAYLLPAILHIIRQPDFKNRSRTSPLCLILVATRELSQKIHLEVIKCSYNIRSVSLYGQGDLNAQMAALQSGVEVVVATIGKLLDFVSKGLVDLTTVSYLVLDEADRMIEMGLMSELGCIVNKTRPDRQTIATTTTWPHDIESIARNFMNDAIKVNVEELDLTALDTVNQTVLVCEEIYKYEMLLNVFHNIKGTDKIIVFIRRKVVANHIALLMTKRNIITNYRLMHGDLDQKEREASLRDLESGRCNLLLATDVASRGLETAGLTLVINFDFPRNMQEYIYRAGWTTRAGSLGKVISIVTWENRNQGQSLIDLLERSRQEVPKELIWLVHGIPSHSENTGNDGGQEVGVGGGERGGSIEGEGRREGGVGGGERRESVEGEGGRGERGEGRCG